MDDMNFSVEEIDLESEWGDYREIWLWCFTPKMNDRIDISLVKSYTFTMFKDYMEFIIFFYYNILVQKIYKHNFTHEREGLIGKENFF